MHKFHALGFAAAMLTFTCSPAQIWIPDINFGVNGVVALPSDPCQYFRDLVLLPDGRIVCAGTVGNSSTNLRGVILRLMANGEPDSTLASSGLFYHPMDEPTEYDGLVVLPDGRMLVGGGNGNDLFLERRHPDGSLDTTFGSGGMSTIYYGNASGKVTDMDLSPLGDILIGGIVSPSGVSDLFKVVTATFSQDGMLMDHATFMTAWNQGTVADAMVVQPADGHIILGGATNISASASRSHLYRRIGTGPLDSDSTFNSTGAFTLQVLGMPHSRVTDVALDSLGRILACGWYSPYSSTGGKRGFVMRLLSNGTLDSTFSSDGIATDDLLTGDEMYNGLTILANGNVAVCGSASFSGNFNDRLIALFFDASGTQMDVFGGDGYFAYMAGIRSQGDAVIQQPDGKIVITGSGFESGYNLLTIRLGEDGTTSSLDAMPAGIVPHAMAVLPNPMLDFGLLHLDLAKPEQVHIELFDVLGKSIAVLLTGITLDAGRHTIPVPANDLVPGQYVLVYKGAAGSTSTTLIIRQ
ncbi:MAG: T9SS type A sorting domain-containing protein [Bacteroidetes bacterium]|nr:T9SS type A sorting domain-containing protein [Bacteroidota bacterium]